MADFMQAVQLTLKNEGGFVNNPADPGGATNMGVEQRDLPDTPIQSLTVAQATAYYLETYWKPIYSSITSQPVASKLFDLGVLFGIGTAVKNLQTALDVEADGNFGPATLAAVNQAAPTLLTTFQFEMAAHAKALAAGNPKLSQFLVGWLRRINS
jgi:lysozyme family protein